MTFETAIEQIRKCAFECGGGKLENNVAWQRLIERYHAMETTLQAIAAMGPKEGPDYSKNAFNSGDDVDFGIALANHGTAELARKALAGGGSQASAGGEGEMHAAIKAEVVLEQSEWKGNWVQTVRLPSGEEIVRTVPQQSAGSAEPVEWRCFHCDEVFTDRKLAEDHFGFTTLLAPACVDPLRGDERAMNERAMEYERSWRKAIRERDAALAAVTNPQASAATEDALGVIESDRAFAEQILADFGSFEEGITDQEKLAQWIRNVRRASSTPDVPQEVWQPIETAPKNHFPVLVYGLYGQLVAFKDVTWKWWPFPAGEDGPLYYTPTHWQPLPASPVTRPHGASHD